MLASFPVVPVHYVPCCWRGRGRCELWCCRYWQPDPSFACRARLQLHGRPCFTFYSPYPSALAVLYCSMRFPEPSLFGPTGQGWSTALGQASRGLLEFVNLVDRTTLSAQATAAGLSCPPCRIATLPAGAWFYIRQPDHGIRSPNYATVIVGQGDLALRTLSSGTALVSHRANRLLGAL